MDNKINKNLNSFRGWTLAFLLMHAPIALYNLLGGLTLIGNFISQGTPFWFVVLSGILSFLLPAAIVLFLKRKAIFRWVYVAYTILMTTNFFISQGITPMSISVALICTAPWVLYLFYSKRVAAILENKKLPAEQISEE